MRIDSEDLQVLHEKCALFSGIETNELAIVLDCLQARIKSYGQDEMLVIAGDKPRDLGVLVQGRLQLIKEDASGHRSIVKRIEPGSIFGEATVYAGVDESPVTILASLPSRVLYVPGTPLITTCEKACPFHTQLLHNLLHLIARRTVSLNYKMDILSKRTTREKLMEFFTLQSKRSGQTTFTIPFNRNELAEYLYLDRSALSRELSRMQDDGLISYKKDTFTLLQ